MDKKHECLTLSENIHRGYLTGQEALVVEEAMRERDACGVTDAGGAEIGDSGGTEVGVRGEGVEEEIVEESGEESGRAKLVPKVERQRALQ